MIFKSDQGEEVQFEIYKVGNRGFDPGGYNLPDPLYAEKDSSKNR
jgi:hypothetical protein